MGNPSDLRQWGKDHINKSLKQVDDSTWMMARFILRRSTTNSDEAMWIDSGDNSAWSLMEAPESKLSIVSDPSRTSPYIKLIHEAGDMSAVWAIGNDVICKVRFTYPNVTHESTILDFVSEKKPSTFKVPEVLRQIFTDDRNFLLIKRLPGQTLDSVWPSLDERWKNYYVSSIVDACIEMVAWKGSEVGGVDGRLLPEYYLAGRDCNFSTVPQRCKALGMDCSNPVFYHADLGPTNIIVGDGPTNMNVKDRPTSNKIGIIDFECAGFFPPIWVRTKFRVSSGHNLTTTSDESATEWRTRVQKSLEARGFEDCGLVWMEKRNDSLKD